MDTLGTAIFFLYREFVLSLEVKMYWYKSEVFATVSFIQSFIYQMFLFQVTASFPHPQPVWKAVFSYTMDQKCLLRPPRELY